jgi:hypothetical protein
VLFLFGAFSALWAQNSGREPAGWFFLGMVFSLITVLVILVKNRADLDLAALPPPDPLATFEPFAASGLGPKQQCPVCHDGFQPHEQPQACRKCRTPYHEDCARGLGGCTTFGCRHFVGQG